jgi:phage protein D
MNGPMVQTESEMTEGRSTTRAGVTIDGVPISRKVDGRLRRVLVDNQVNLPGMFELTFLDFDGSTLSVAGLDMGSKVEINGGVGAPLITGEVTAIEGILDGQRRFTVVRGYTGAHRLQRARRSRTFLNTTDTDIAVKIALEARLPLGEVVPTTMIHGYLAQVNQTDWEFLRSRAEEIGYRVGVSEGLFYFKPVLGIGASVGVTVSFPHNLISFRPRVTAANLTPDVEVRVWDPLQMRAFAEQSTLPAAGVLSPSMLGAQFGEGGVAGAVVGTATTDVSTVASDAAPVLDETLGPAVTALGGPLGTLGPAPSPTAHVVNDRPVASGLEITTAGQGAANALGADLSGTYAEAEGDAFGNPLIQPGTHVTVTGTQYPFDGSWLVSHARHVFDDEEHGYRTTFAAHGRQDRSMLGLTSLGNAGQRQHRATLDGLVCGVVSNVLDPLGRARVKVTLPWLSPDFETDWAPVGQGCAGPSGGSLYLPGVGDEVVLAFEYGDPRRPYVLGSVVNNYTAWTLSTGGGPGAAMAALAGGLGGMGGQLASAAGSLQSLAGDIASVTAAGALLNATGMAPPGMSGSPGNLGSAASNTAGDLYGLSTPGQAASLVGIGPPPGLGGGQSTPGMAGAGVAGTAASALAGLGAVQESPGMVGEVIRRGYVSDTGNVLVFDDEPLTPTGGTTATGELGAVTGGAAATPALTSSITLGSQNGTHGLYVDQVAAMVLLQSNATPGVSMSETPLLIISAGTTGSVIINAGTDVTIASEKALTMMAPEIMIAGETVTVVGELIPLTPG